MILEENDQDNSVSIQVPEENPLDYNTFEENLFQRIDVEDEIFPFHDYLNVERDDFQEDSNSDEDNQPSNRNIVVSTKRFLCSIIFAMVISYLAVLISIIMGFYVNFVNNDGYYTYKGRPILGLVMGISYSLILMLFIVALFPCLIQWNVLCGYTICLPLHCCASIRDNFRWILVFYLILKCLTFCSMQTFHFLAFLVSVVLFIVGVVRNILDLVYDIENFLNVHLPPVFYRSQYSVFPLIQITVISLLFCALKNHKPIISSGIIVTSTKVVYIFTICVLIIEFEGIILGMRNVIEDVTFIVYTSYFGGKDYEKPQSFSLLLISYLVLFPALNIFVVFFLLFSWMCNCLRGSFTNHIIIRIIYLNFAWQFLFTVLDLVFFVLANYKVLGSPFVGTYISILSVVVSRVLYFFQSVVALVVYRFVDVEFLRVRD